MKIWISLLHQLLSEWNVSLVERKPVYFKILKAYSLYLSVSGTKVDYPLISSADAYYKECLRNHVIPAKLDAVIPHWEFSLIEFLKASENNISNIT